MSLPRRLHPDCIVQRDPQVLGAEAGEDIVMVSIENGLYYGVSETAREIWQAIEHPKKIADLIDHLLKTHDIDRSTCEQQTLAFLENLMSEHLLKVKDESNS